MTDYEYRVLIESTGGLRRFCVLSPVRFELTGEEDLWGFARAELADGSATADASVRIDFLDTASPERISSTETTIGALADYLDLDEVA